MDKTRESREKALKNLKIANHLLTQSYPLIADPKLLLAVLQNISIALEHAMTAILQHARENKEIPPFPENFETKFDVFKLKVAPNYKVPPNHLQSILDVRSMIASHKKSSVSFSRKDAFVICEEGYKLRTLTIDDMKKILKSTKEFISIMEKILTNG